MEEIILGLITNEKVTSLDEIVRRTNFEKALVSRVLTSLVSQGRIVFDFQNSACKGCMSCPLFKTCKLRR